MEKFAKRSSKYEYQLRPPPLYFKWLLVYVVCYGNKYNALAHTAAKEWFILCQRQATWYRHLLYGFSDGPANPLPNYPTKWRYYMITPDSPVKLN